MINVLKDRLFSKNVCHVKVSVMLKHIENSIENNKVCFVCFKMH